MREERGQKILKKNLRSHLNSCFCLFNITISGEFSISIEAKEDYFEIYMTLDKLCEDIYNQGVKMLEGG